MFSTALNCCAKAIDRADYLITIARLIVLDWIAGPMPEGPFSVADPGALKPARTAAELEFGFSPADDVLALGRDHDRINAPAAALAAERRSGNLMRPVLHDALEFARNGDTLIVWKLDRLARSMEQLIETIEDLRVRGIGFRSLTEALDTTTAQGRPVFHMFGALAEFERSLIRERPQAGVAGARRLGRTGGRPPKLTDDDIEAAKALLADPDIGVTQIAHRLGVSPATLYR
jgi:hypothetical protein